MDNTAGTTEAAAAADPFNFSSALIPQTRSLSKDQLRSCSKAVEFFDEKLRSEQTIRDEFQKLEKETEVLDNLDKENRCSIALKEQNWSKNRYPRVVPFDNNRVVLKQHENYRPSNGYINASPVVIETSEGVSQFIATQGPLQEASEEDFWEMIVQYRCPVIIMLTRLVDDDNTEKCGDYFQAEDRPNRQREFGNICIVNKWIRTTDNSLILRWIEVKNKESKKPPFPVLHIQYPDWPDMGVPSDTAAIREIFRRVSVVPPSLGPIVVHCSAGIGRTGTYCAIHNTIQRILHSSSIGDMTDLDLINTVTRLRSQRVGMVQILEQYIFCYKAILDELKNLLINANGNGDCY